MEKAESRSLGGEKKRQGEEASNNFDIHFITTHNPNDNDCYPIVKEVCEMLKKDENMEKVFKNKNVIKSKRQPKNVKQILAKSINTQETQKHTQYQDVVIKNVSCANV